MDAAERVNVLLLPFRRNTVCNSLGVWIIKYVKECNAVAANMSPNKHYMLGQEKQHILSRKVCASVIPQ